MSEPTFKERMAAALAKIDSTPVPAQHIKGVLYLNPACMENEEGDNVALTVEVAAILRQVFHLLGYSVPVLITHTGATRALSRNLNIDEARTIKHITNLAFQAFFDASYDTDVTLNLLEDRGFIPRLTAEELGFTSGLTR
jgi:Flp pilus assembly secretin CpaC